MKTGTELIAEERQRQVSAEGWTPEHDDTHQKGELIDAGLSYLLAAINTNNTVMQNPPREWPWERGCWKPSPDPVRNLVKAGALLAAEIDRRQRMTKGAVKAEPDDSTTAQIAVEGNRLAIFGSTWGYLGPVIQHYTPFEGSEADAIAAARRMLAAKGILCYDVVARPRVTSFRTSSSKRGGKRK